MKNASKCQGCRNNFYNGHNDLGVKQCWSLAEAKVIRRRRVGINERPPWTRKPEQLPDCYQQAGYVFVKPTTTS